MVVMIAIAVMIMIVPVAFGMPAAVVLAPPAVKAVPAALAGLPQFLPCMSGLWTIPTMMLGRLVKAMVGTDHPALAVVRISDRMRRPRRKQERAESCRGQSSVSQEPYLSQQESLHELPSGARLTFGGRPRI